MSEAGKVDVTSPESKGGVWGETEVRVKAVSSTRLWFVALGVVRLGGVCGVAFVMLLLALFILDYQTLEAYPAPHVKKLRFPLQSNVFRDEGFSRFWTNSYGLIGPEPGAPSNQSTYRVAVFGDSYAEALQVKPKQRFSSLIADGLPPPLGFEKVEAWNYGFSGDNTGNAYARWVHQRSGVAFHLILFAFTDQDLFENRPSDVSGASGAFLVRTADGRYALDDTRIDAQANPLTWKIKRFFGQFFTAIYNLRQRIDSTLAEKRGRLQAFVGRGGLASVKSDADVAAGRIPDGAVEDTCAQLKHVHDSMRSDGATVLLLGLPSEYVVLDEEIRRDSRRHHAYRAVMRCLVQAGIDVADPRVPLVESARAGRDPFRDWNQKGGHFNSAGHRIITDVVLSRLRPEAVVGPESPAR